MAPRGWRAWARRRRSIEDVCTPPPILHVAEPDDRLADLYARKVAALSRASIKISKSLFSGDTPLNRSYFGDIAPIAFEGPQSKNPLAYRYYDKKRVVARQDHGAATAHGGVLLAHLQLGRIRYFRRRHFQPALARRPAGSGGRRSQAQRSVRILHAARVCPTSAFTTSTSWPRPTTSASTSRIFTHGATRSRRKMAATGRQAAVGHGESVQPSALHGGRRHQSRSGGVSLRRHAGAPLSRGDAPLARRELRALGRTRRLRHAAEHQPEAGEKPARPVHLHGGGTQAQDRLQGRDPDRAQAA